MTSRGTCLLFVCLLIGLTGVRSIEAAQEPQPAISSEATVGQRAVHVVISNYIIDSTVLVPKTAKLLPANGSWSVGKETPAICPKTSAPCLRVLYRVPDTDVSCEWVVLLDGADSPGVVLDANADVARYLIERLPPKEAKKQIISGQNPIYPPIARAAHVTGSVRLAIHVSALGTVDRITIVDGPEQLRSAAVDAVKQWKYKPMTVGSNAVPFQTVVTLNFHMSG